MSDELELSEGVMEDGVYFLLRLDEAPPGTYDIILSLLGCPPDSRLLDYPLSPLAAPAEAFTMFPGPGRARPDTLIRVPPSPDLNPSGGVEIAAWGGVIHESVWETRPDLCTTGPVLHLELEVKSGTFSLVWAANVAQGTPMPAAPLILLAEVTAVGQRTITILPPSGAAAPLADRPTG
jgi:hypothetical protein